MSSEHKSSRAPVGALVRAILSGYRQWWGLLAIGLAGMLYQVGFNLFLPLATRHVFDQVLPIRDRRGLFVIAIALVAALVLRVIIGIVQERSMAAVTARTMAARRAQMFDALQSRTAAYHQKTPAADTLARFSADLAVVETATTRLMPRVMYSVLNIAGCTVLMLVLDPRLAAAIAVMLVIAFVGPRRLGARAAAWNGKRRDAEGKLLATVQESIALHNVIRMFAVESWVRSTHQAKLDDFRDNAARATLAGSNVEMFTVLAFATVQVLVVCVGGWLVIEGNLSMGQLIAFTALVGTISGSMFGLSSMLPPLIESSIGYSRIAALFETEAVSGTTALPTLAGAVRLDHVSFSYTGERADLKDVSLEIPAGTSAAFVGPSGSGKSTALTLITRANTPKSGRVLIDEHDLAHATSASLYSQIGIVAQESLLFDTTVRENIRVGRLDATDAEIEDAARKAEIHDAILGMTHGYDTPVGDRGGNLSGGQRQRIAIARAILRNPRIIVLDEATSALDPATEEAVSKTLDKLGSGRTTISVTHRLATVQGYGCIFVMKDGELAERGTHAALLAAGGIYRQLWDKQNGVTVAAEGHAAVSPALLATMPVLSSLDEVARTELAARFVTMTFGEGHELFRAGDPGDAFYVIARGQIEIEVPAAAGAVLRRLSEGDGFGEIALLSAVPRTATARTLTACTLLVLPRDVFAAMMQRFPNLAATLTAKADAHLAADRAI